MFKYFVFFSNMPSKTEFFVYIFECGCKISLFGGIFEESNCILKHSCLEEYHENRLCKGKLKKLPLWYPEIKRLSILRQFDIRN